MDAVLPVKPKLQVRQTERAIQLPLIHKVVLVHSLHRRGHPMNGEKCFDTT